MTDEPTLAWAPEACTLPTAEKPLRRAEFDELFAATVGVRRRTDRHVRFELTGGPDLADRIRDLAARETECCSFFTFTVTPTAANRVTFDIEVPADRVDVLDGLLARAARIRTGR